MGLQISDDPFIPESTGAVTTPTDPVTTVQPFTNDPAGAVEFNGDPVTTKFGPSGQKPTGTVETPGPVTFENTVVKVVNAPARSHTRGASTAETESRSHRAQEQSSPDGR